jgi:hypothetical protein
MRGFDPMMKRRESLTLSVGRDFREKPTAERGFKGPVRWLLGRQLIASLKGVALYTAFGDKLDHKDWMRPEVIDLSRAELDESGAFWFDYISDTGDGHKAVYSIAYLSLSELWTDARPTTGSPVHFEAAAENPHKLPRGAFLFVGGDTGYHIADYATLGLRFQAPFCWAFRDLEDKGKVSQLPRPIFGIPGNHDYYDSLDGFNRQFRQPFDPQAVASFRHRDDGARYSPQLEIPGFERKQQTSFVALKLPAEWWFLGLDTQHGRIDLRQLFFFRQCQASSSMDNLIVTTPEPATVFGKYPKQNSKIAMTFEELGLERVFLRGGGSLPEGKIRLDLSGDVHHYARYWGPPINSTAKAPSRANYASVVSGTGGAFLHPSHTDVGEIEEQVLYPPKGDSRREIAKRLLNPAKIAAGGYIWLGGAVLSLLTAFAATIPESSRAAVSSLLEWLHLPAENLEPAPSSGIDRLLLTVSKTFVIRRPVLGDHSELQYLIPFLSLLLLAGLLIGRQCEKAKKRSVPWYSYWSLLLLPLAAVAVFRWVREGGYQGLSPLVSSLMVLFFVFVFLGGVVASFRYTAALSRQAKFRSVRHRDYVAVWLIMAFAVASACFGFWRYGVDSAAVLVADWIFILVVLLAVVGLPLFGWTGSKLLDPKARVWFVVLGLWHALLQLSVPFLLVAYARDWRIIVAAAVVVPFSWVGYQLAKRDRKWELLFAWVLLGVTELAIAVGNPRDGSPMTVLAFVFVFALGAFFSCVWFGWYLTVALAFNGHNNEAGGGARLEKYKQLIRFRLTKETLTAFVIAVDDPGWKGWELKPKLVDVFELKAKRGSAPAKSEVG